MLFQKSLWKTCLCMTLRVHIHISLQNRCLEMELLGWEDRKVSKRKKAVVFLCHALLWVEFPWSPLPLSSSSATQSLPWLLLHPVAPGPHWHHLLPLSLQPWDWHGLPAVTNLWVPSTLPVALSALPTPSNSFPAFMIDLGQGTFLKGYPRLRDPHGSG